MFLNTCFRWHITITYKLNGGSYDGKTVDIKEIYPESEIISIHSKPIRDGYIFLYWRGSQYQPGEEYEVVGDHTFTAIWKKESGPTPPYVIPPTGD